MKAPLVLPHPNVELKPRPNASPHERELIELAKKLQENLDYICTHWPE